MGMLVGLGLSVQSFDKREDAMKSQGWLAYSALCLLAVIGAVVYVQAISAEVVADAANQSVTAAPRVVEAERCIWGLEENCTTAGEWQLWETPGASNGWLIHNELAPWSGIGVPATLTLKFRGTGVGVDYLQDWYRILGVRIDDHLEHCIDQGGPSQHQTEVCFDLDGRGSHTLIVSAGEPTGTITGVVTLDAMRVYTTAEPCGPRHSLCDTGIIVPAYFDPRSTEGSDYWDRLAAAASILGERLIVIANILNGSGTEPIEEYVDAIGGVVGRGGQVIGYVYTCYGNQCDEDPEREWCPRPIDVVLEDISRWYAFYPMDGIFFDEVSTSTAKANYYQALHDYVQGKQGKGTATIVFNHGMAPQQDYSSIGSSILCTFEDPLRNFAGWVPPACCVGWSAPAWISRARSCALVYETPESTLPEGLAHLSNTETGWFYFTDDTLLDLNPWDTLPPYFEILVMQMSCKVYLPLVLKHP
jgi:hypothetical protein